MEIGKAIGFIFKDPQWVAKVLIGGLLSLVPVVGTFMVLGYMLRTAENVARDVEMPLPEWNDFGDLFVRGLYAFVIVLVYLLPLLVLYFGFVIVLSVASVGIDPSNADMAASAGGAIGLLSLCMIPVFLILGLAGALLSYAGLGRYLRSGKLGDGLQFGAVIAEVRSAPGAWFMVLLVAFLAGLLASVGLIACGVGVIFTQFMAYAVNGHALGQTMRARGMIPQAAAAGYTAV
jgi:hypothetical protein